METFTLIVTAEELFVMEIALEHLAEVDDGEYSKIAYIAGSMVLPDSGISWAGFNA